MPNEIERKLSFKKNIYQILNNLNAAFLESKTRAPFTYRVYIIHAKVWFI
jgi:hypothetical protein